ncbi:MAG: insulinase family protein, partial [Candidatus Aminicenantes bacterium]|nr:insulinase family protein [Candidatus Aminicenantes bacterium]
MKKSALALGLLALVAASGRSTAQERPRRPPPIEPLAVLKLPELQFRELANGLKLWLAFRDTSSLMSLDLLFDGGESASPEKGPGMATLASALLNSGTFARRLPQFEEDIEAMGGDLTVQATPDAVHLRFRFLDEFLDEALALVGEMILQPDYTERAVQIAKTSITYDLLDRERDPEFAARRHVLRLLFAGHPYGRSTFGREAIRGWTLKDLLAFVGQTFRPNNTQILLVGNATINTATRKVSHYLNTWPRRDGPSPARPSLRPPDRDRFAFIDVPKMSDCLVFAGTVLPPLSAGESTALQVLNQILGGSLFARLNLSLRESKGYARFATSEVLPFRAGSVFLIKAAVPSDVLVQAVGELLAETRKLAKEPPLADEVAQAKGYLMAHFP